MALQTKLQRRAGQMRQSGSSVWRRNATMIASSSNDGTVDFGSPGPIGRSVTQIRWVRLATVSWLMPQSQHWCQNSLGSQPRAQRT